MIRLCTSMLVLLPDCRMPGRYRLIPDRAGQRRDQTDQGDDRPAIQHQNAAVTVIGRTGGVPCTTPPGYWPGYPPYRRLRTGVAARAG